MGKVKKKLKGVALLPLLFIGYVLFACGQLLRATACLVIGEPKEALYELKSINIYR